MPDEPPPCNNQVESGERAGHRTVTIESEKKFPLSIFIRRQSLTPILFLCAAAPRRRRFDFISAADGTERRAPFPRYLRFHCFDK